MSKSRILYKRDNRICILTKVLNVIPGEGRSEDWKTGLLVSTGRQQVILNCWNSKNPEKPQMATRAKQLKPGDTIVALIIAQNGEFSCIAYLKDEGFLSIDNNGYPIFIIYGNVRIDNSPGDSYRVAVPLHYRNRKCGSSAALPGKKISRRRMLPQTELKKSSLRQRDVRKSP